jgi:hypothetical protein
MVYKENLMSELREIINRNFLSPLNFKFQLKRAPHINFFVQKVNLPGLTLPDIDINNPLIRIPYAGDHLMYDELNISFKVDEDLQNYMELHDWLRSLGKPSYQEYKNLATNSSYTGEGLRSDISLTILTSNKNANYEITFTDAFPIKVSGIDFNSSGSDVDYIEASANFRYVIYNIQKIT